MGDLELLEQYVRERSEAAFAELVRRHIGWVHLAALRQVRQRELAEDVTQAVFIALAQQARKLCRIDQPLSPWLFQVVRYASRTALRSEGRRKRHEQGAAAMRSEIGEKLTQAEWEQVAPLLDELVARLGEKDRRAVLLRFYERKSLAEVGKEMGVSEAAAQKRIERTVEKLRGMFGRRGVAMVSGAMLAAGLEAHTVRAADAALTAAATKSALAAAQGGVVGGPLMAIAEGALKMMAWAKVKVAVVMVVVAFGVGGAVMGQVAGLHRSGAEARDSATTKQAQNLTGRAMRVHVVDVAGTPIEGANVHTSVCTNEPPKVVNRDYGSDAAGLAVVELPKTMYIVRIWTSKDGHVPMFTHWEQEWFDAGRSAPAEVTITLKKGTSIGGFVKNEEGQPIAGARIGVQMIQPGGEPQSMASRWLAEGNDARVTDAKGQWTLDNVPEDDGFELSVSITHPDYVSDLRWGGLQGSQNVTTALLREQKATIVMQRGTSLTGQVTDPQGKGIAGAVVVWGDDPYGDTGIHQEHKQEVRTDANGVYRLPPMARTPMTVTAVAVGWMPELKKTTIAPETSKLDFQLKMGKSLKLRFVDSLGKPIPEVAVGIEGWRGCKSLYNIKHPIVLETQIPRSAGRNGVYQWAWAPDDEVQYQFWKQGYKMVTKSIIADEAEQTIQLAVE